MARRVSTGIIGGPVLGTVATVGNVLQTVQANEDIVFQPDGTGDVEVDSHLRIRDASSLQLLDSNSDHYVALKSPATVTTDITYTLPGSGITDGYALTTNASGTLSWTNVAVQVSDDSATTNNLYVPFINATSGTITSVSVSSGAFTYQPSTGTLTSTIFNETSSIALKENLNPLDDALDKVLSLNAFTYDRKDGSQINEPGLIAEDVNKILPNIVSKDADGNPQSIAYSRLTAYLIESIKSLSKQIEDLKGDK